MEMNTYSERLSRLKLQSLELRHLVADFLWCYKIVFNVVDISADAYSSATGLIHVVTLVGIRSNYLRPVSSTKTIFFSDRVVNFCLLPM